MKKFILPGFILPLFATCNKTSIQGNWYYLSNDDLVSDDEAD